MSDKCIYYSIGNCEGKLFPTNVQDNVICDYHRRHFSSASWGYVEKLEAEIEKLEGRVERLRGYNNDLKAHNNDLRARVEELEERCGTLNTDRLDAMRLVDEWQSKFYDELARVRKLEELEEFQFQETLGWRENALKAEARVEEIKSNAIGIGPGDTVLYGTAKDCEIASEWLATHTFDDEMIDRAWKDRFTEGSGAIHLKAKLLHIFRCERCDGEGEIIPVHKSGFKCPDCAKFTGHGWVIGGDDE
jgi:hypothetical protein